MLLTTGDFETCSPLNLKKVGGYKYASHPETDMLCFAWAYDEEEEVHLWHPEFAEAELEEEGVDELFELHERILLGEIILEAHNAFFERCVWHFVGRRRGWPALDPRQLRCSAAKAASFSLPRQLEKAVEALELPFPKDMEGHRLMLKLSKPRKPRKAELQAVGMRMGQEAEFTARYGHLWYRDRDELLRVFEYNRQDVRAERALSSSLRDLSPKEQEVWFLDQEINWNGVHVDLEGIDKALSLVAEITRRGNEEMRDLTMGDVESCTKRDQFIAWCASEGVHLPNTQKETIDSFCEMDDLPQHVGRAMRIWSTCNKASVKKYVAMRDRACDDGRVRDILMYWGAGPGRWSGRGIQPQNFARGYGGPDPKKPKKLWMEPAWDQIVEMDLDQLADFHPDVMDHLSKSTRGAICAAPGKELSVADYSAIEARVLFWLAGEARALEVLHAGQVIYKDMAGAILLEMEQDKPGSTDPRYLADPQSMPKEGQTYQLGKQAVLGLGYQMGGKKFRITCAGYGIEIDLKFANRVVKLYRGTYPKVPKLWDAYEAAAIAAVKRGPRAKEPVRVGDVAFAMRGQFLHVKLPSGRLISYFRPRIIQAPMPWDEKDLRDKLIYWGVDDKKRWRIQDTYGGKLTENIDQGIARDLMAEAMLRCQEYGYTPVLTVHDEIVAEDELSDREIREFEELMAQLPAWAEGLPIAAEGWKGRRYRK